MRPEAIKRTAKNLEPGEFQQATDKYHTALSNPLKESSCMNSSSTQSFEEGTDKSTRGRQHCVKG
jgi:hypothetical protein